MPKILVPAQVEQYEVEGATFPVRVMSAGQAAGFLARLEEGERADAEGSGRRRIGFGASCIPTRVRCTGTVRHTAMLVRCRDMHGHRDLEPRIRTDFDPAVDALRRDAIVRYGRARDEQVALHNQRLAGRSNREGTRS